MNRQFGMMLIGSAGLDLSKGAAATYDAATEMAIPQTVGLGLSFRPAER